MRYLSDEWIDALDAAARSHPGLRAAARGTDLVVQQTVTGVPGGAGSPDDDVTYRIELGGGEVRVVLGPALDPTVSLATDHDTARAIARGELATQLAFMQGRIRIGGNVLALLVHQEAMAEIDDVFAGVHARTEW